MTKATNSPTNEKECTYCGGWGSDNGWPCPECGKEQIR